MTSLRVALPCVILFSLSPSLSHHVVFEEIGEMAGALSYIHDDWFHQWILELFQMALSDADAMLKDINGLQSILPPVAAESHLPHEEHEYRIR